MKITGLFRDFPAGALITDPVSSTSNPSIHPFRPVTFPFSWWPDRVSPLASSSCSPFLVCFSSRSLGCFLSNVFDVLRPYLATLFLPVPWDELSLCLDVAVESFDS